MSMPPVFDFTFTMERGEEEMALLQHRQLHMLFTSILCTAILPILHYACPTLLYVLPDCSADGVSPPSGAIRNLRPIL